MECASKELGILQKIFESFKSTLNAFLYVSFLAFFSVLDAFEMTFFGAIEALCRLQKTLNTSEELWKLQKNFEAYECNQNAIKVFNNLIFLHLFIFGTQKCLMNFWCICNDLYILVLQKLFKCYKKNAQFLFVFSTPFRCHSSVLGAFATILKTFEYHWSLV